MKKELFVAGLDFSLNSEDLEKVFSEHGKVTSAKVINDKFSGKSRGFGFVEMSSVEEAKQCVDKLDNSSLNGRQIAVKFKEDRPDTRQKGSFNNNW